MTSMAPSEADRLVFPPRGVSRSWRLLWMGWVVLAVWGITGCPMAADLVISEFMADNTRTVRDEDGEF